MDRPLQELVKPFFQESRREVIDFATDWIFGQSVDLKGHRPREETRNIIVRMTSAYEAALLHNDFGPLADFVEMVATFRASTEFHPSTLLKGAVSVRRAIEHLAPQRFTDPALVLQIVEAFDNVCFDTMMRMADSYAAKLNHTILERRQELERVLQARERELQAKIETIRQQQDMLAALSSPVIQIWDKILLVPLVGEITADRASQVKRKLLDTIAERETTSVLIDITGLTVADEHAGAVLVKMVQACRLLGAEGMLVGMSAAVARSLMDQVDLREARTFASLQDGLVAALEMSERDSDAADG